MGFFTPDTILFFSYVTRSYNWILGIIDFRECFLILQAFFIYFCPVLQLMNGNMLCEEKLLEIMLVYLEQSLKCLTKWVLSEENYDKYVCIEI